MWVVEESMAIYSSSFTFGDSVPVFQGTEDSFA